MSTSAQPHLVPGPDRAGDASLAGAPRILEDIYDRQFAFVWRSARRLGAPEFAIDEVVQDVFMVLHRRLAEFDFSSSEETLLFGITMRVVSDHRRARTRRQNNIPTVSDEKALETAPAPEKRPDEELAAREGQRILYRLLDELDDERRAIFVSVELEQMPVPAVARAMNLKVNTAYTKLRAARQQFEKALAKHMASETGRGAR